MLNRLVMHGIWTALRVRVLRAGELLLANDKRRVRRAEVLILRGRIVARAAIVRHFRHSRHSLMGM